MLPLFNGIILQHLINYYFTFNLHVMVSKQNLTITRIQMRLHLLLLKYTPIIYNQVQWFRVHTTSLTSPLFIEVPVPSQESER